MVKTLLPHIRTATPEDAPAVVAIYAPIVEKTPISFELEAPSLEEMRSRIEKTLLRLPWLVSVDGEGIVEGYAYAGAHRERPAYQWSVDVTAYVRQDVRRTGVGRRLYTALFDQLRILGYCQVFAGITLPNPASVGLHESLGFDRIGVFRSVGFKFGQWRDVGWWQMTLQSPVHPEAPSRFAG